MKTVYKKLFAGSLLLATATFAWTQEETADAYDADSLAQINKTKIVNRSNTTVSSVLLGENPIPMDESSIFEYNTFNTDVVQTDVFYMYYPKTQAVVMVLSSALSKYYVFFDKNDRAVLRTAYKQYLEDFSAKRLNKNSNKTYNAYGEITSEFRMGMIGTSVITKPKTSVGYKFVKKSPYFTLTLWPAELESFMPGADAETSSGSDKMSFFLTKKQAAVLAECCDEARIQELLAQTTINEVIEQDEY